MKNLILIAAALSTGACATVIRGTKDNARFESEPPGATVTAESNSDDLLGPFSCTTPCELNLKRKREWNIVYELEGYKSVTGLLEPKVTGGGVAAGVGNVIAGGIIGIGVDAGTGANLDLRPNPMIAELEPEDSDLQSRILLSDEEDLVESDKEGLVEQADEVEEEVLEEVVDEISAPDASDAPEVLMEETGADE